ncbi:MAG: hypothetical protein WAO90_11260, partial [Mycobacterium sp.]
VWCGNGFPPRSTPEALRVTGWHGFNRSVQLKPNSAAPDRATRKAAFARAIGSDPSTVRRPLSSELVNPTLGTIAEGSAALGMKVMLAPMSAEEHARITEPDAGLHLGRSRGCADVVLSGQRPRVASEVFIPQCAPLGVSPFGQGQRRRYDCEMHICSNAAKMQLWWQ